MNKKYWKNFLREEPRDEFSKNLKFVVQNCSQKEIVRQMQEAVFLLYSSICNLCFNLNKKEKNMYFISCFEHLPPKERDWDIGNCTTVGYSSSYEYCVKELHENRFDFYEGCYNFAVIEKYCEGIYPFCEERQFFKYSNINEIFFEITEPKELKDIGNFAIR